MPQLTRNKVMGLIAATLIIILLIPYTTLSVTRLDTNEVIIQKLIIKDTQFKMRWIHSVELTPWEEIFEISDGKIYLTETRFQSFGAGVPDAAGNHTETADGYVTYSGINQEMPILNYGISPIAKHELILGREARESYKLYELLPDDTPVSFQALKASLFKRMLK